MLINISPFTRINDSIAWSESICEIKNKIIPTTIKYDDYDTSSLDTQYQLKDLQKSFLYVCTETVFDYPHSYLSEKSYKGITVKRPFIIVGAPNSLGLLREYGFKTFDRWWDESYDSEDDPSRRISKICAIIKDISDLSTDQLKDMCLEMSPVLEYNFQHYKIHSQNELERFDKACGSIKK